MGDEGQSGAVPGSAVALSSEAMRRKATGGETIGRLKPLASMKDVVWLAGGTPNSMAFPMTSITVDLCDGSQVVIEDCTPALGGAKAGGLYIAQQYMEQKCGHQELVDWYAFPPLVPSALLLLVSAVAGGADSP